MTANHTTDPLRRYGDEFERHLYEMRAQGAGDAEIERAGVLETLLAAIEDMNFSTDDLRFILVLLAMCWDKHPARLYAQFLHSGGGTDQPAAAPAS